MHNIPLHRHAHQQRGHHARHTWFFFVRVKQLILWCTPRWVDQGSLPWLGEPRTCTTQVVDHTNPKRPYQTLTFYSIPLFSKQTWGNRQYRQKWNLDPWCVPSTLAWFTVSCFTVSWSNAWWHEKGHKRGDPAAYADGCSEQWLLIYWVFYL